jgi:hypothetical protein
MAYRRIATLVAALSFGLASAMLAAQSENLFTLKTPNGIALSEFKGYDTWQAIAPSQPADGIKVIVGNPSMIKAYADGFPGNDRTVPDGAMMAKIAWSTKANPLQPSGARVPDALKRVQFMVKDAKRFPDTDGWGYADVMYDAASDTFRSVGNGPSFAKAACHQCHTIAKARDFVFTEYARR